MADRWLTTAQAADALSISRSTLAKWRRNGLVEPVLITVGGHARWDLAKLREDLRALSEAAAKAVEGDLDAAHALTEHDQADDVDGPADNPAP